MTSAGRGMTTPEFDHGPNHATQQSLNDPSNVLFISEKARSSRVEVLASPKVAELLQEEEDNLVESQYHDVKIETRRHTLDSYVQVESPTFRSKDGLEIKTITARQTLEKYLELSENLRVIFISKRNSDAPLEISSDFFKCVCLQLDVPQRFHDYVVYMGQKEMEFEIAPPPARIVQSSGKDHQAYHFSCGLRYVDTNNRTDVEEPTTRWSFRQSAVFGRCDQRRNVSSWVFVAVSRMARRRVRKIWASSKSVGGVTALEILFALYDTAVCNWRPYVAAIALEIEQHKVNNALGSSPDGTGPLAMASSKDRQQLLILEDKLSVAKLAIRATRGDLLSFLDTCRKEHQGQGDASDFVSALEVSVRDLELNIIRLEQLEDKMKSVISLVASFLELSNGLSLQALTRESKNENENVRRLNEEMHELAKKNVHDSATITVLTILTLIYLPLTVVSNFFSTSFVGTSQSNRIYITQDWWILLASAVPLTFVTLYTWWVWSSIKADEKYPFWWPRPHARKGTGVVRDRRHVDKGFVSEGYGPGYYG